MRFSIKILNIRSPNIYGGFGENYKISPILASGVISSLCDISLFCPFSHRYRNFLYDICVKSLFFAKFPLNRICNMIIERVYNKFEKYIAYNKSNV